MDKSALFNVSYGVYIVATKDGSRKVGCVVNSVIQVTSDPVTIAISINKDNHTNPCLLETGKFTISVLSEQTDGAVIGTFGFQSSRDTDKFAQVDYMTIEDGLPVVTAGACSWFACKVLGTLDAFTHTIVLAEVTDAGNLNKEPPMTYAYYHKVIKGKAPKNAPTYIAQEAPAQKEAYVCSVCGYVYPDGKEEFEAEPETYTCPICGVPKSKFEWKTV